MSIRILVVDKARQTVELARFLFGQLGYEISPATSISLALYLAHKSLPCLIIIGTEMTDGDGLRLIKELKADQELKIIPIAFIGNDNNQKTKALSLGADRSFVYPINNDDFLLAILPFLKKLNHTRKEETSE